MEIYWWTVSWTELDHFKLAQSLNDYIKDLVNVTVIKIICQNCKIFKIFKRFTCNLDEIHILLYVVYFKIILYAFRNFLKIYCRKY